MYSSACVPMANGVLNHFLAGTLSGFLRKCPCLCLANKHGGGGLGRAEVCTSVIFLSTPAAAQPETPATN